MTASELAKEWREERLEFDDALLRHLVENLGLVMIGPPLVVGIGMAISWVNMGLSDVVLDLGCQPMTAQEVVEKFELEPFLEAAE